MIKKYIIAAFLVSSFSAIGADNLKYDEKKRLVCELTYLSPEFSDLFVGDMRSGWLRVKDDYYQSVEVGGWAIYDYGDRSLNSNSTLYINDIVGSIVKVNKKTGGIKMQFKSDDNIRMHWSCMIGRHLKNNKEN